ncbi:MAG: PLP-dependent aminotransferase family protein [Cellulophaga sp.]
MIPYKTIIELDRKNRLPLYIQLANQFIVLIKNQTIAASAKLPGTRTLAAVLDIHRKTVIACYDELIIQGWIESIPKKGTFVIPNLPILDKHDFSCTKAEVRSICAGFSFENTSILNGNFKNKKEGYVHFNDGVSDTRFAPVDEISSIYRRLIKKKRNQKYLTYGNTHGNPELRSALVDYLNDTRGLYISEENILITRGSQMGIYLASQLLLKQGNFIIVGETNYISADISFKHAGATLLRVAVDEHGLDTKEIEKLCKTKSIKAVYVTPHHHHPTTVTLCAERRLHLLNLAQKYNFAILEDDYDYDFHFNHAPILPLSSHDTNGNVIYIGSVCKTVAPVFRVGYLIASKDFVDACAAYRRNVDCQGDSILELTFSHFIRTGGLDRHINKLLKIYRTRRDLFCTLLEKELSEYFSFETPKGGLAIWLVLNKKYDWELVAKEALKYKLDVGNWKKYCNDSNNHNALRIGFATYNEEEIIELVGKLKTTMTSLKPTLNNSLRIESMKI